MVLEMVHTDQAPAAIGPYSQAIKVDRWLFVSGQIGLLPATGQLADDDLAGQARQALRNVHRILETAGYRLADVVSVDMFLEDIGQFAILNGIYEEFFAGHKPARAVVGVNGLPRGALIEIKCVAYKSI